jgi:colicin import membrane protein
MAEYGDGIEEAFEGQIRTLIGVATMVAEKIMVAREQRLRQAAHLQETKARDTQMQVKALRDSHNVVVGQMMANETWWDTQTPESIANTYRMTASWPDEAMRQARQHMNVRLQEKYGIDVGKINHDRLTPEIQAAISKMEHQATMEEKTIELTMGKEKTPTNEKSVSTTKLAADELEREEQNAHASLNKCDPNQSHTPTSLGSMSEYSTVISWEDQRRLERDNHEAISRGMDVDMVHAQNGMSRGAYPPQAAGIDPVGTNPTQHQSGHQPHQRRNQSRNQQRRL